MTFLTPSSLHLLHLNPHFYFDIFWNYVNLLLFSVGRSGTMVEKC